MSHRAPLSREGSSPLTRGKPPAAGHVVRRGGLIPAHAGKTSVHRRCARQRWAHPRSRGENVIGQLLSAVGEGSSPLTRGKQDDCGRGGLSVGLIPAHAGKTDLECVSVSGEWAHPRSRGENFYRLRPVQRGRGSSPLTRGKPPSSSSQDAVTRLIPAHAGKTRRWVAVCCRLGAHPRSRGENPGLVCQVLMMKGSSPLTRGKRYHRRPPGPPRRAHPRSRGENTVGALAVLPERGSSPLTRGKRSIGSICTRAWRLIPAHAGKTGTWPSPGRRTWAHPRSRGENLPLSCEPPMLVGSSPLTRGKPVVGLARDHARGLIPAHAGKTG